ncbi:histone acetyltransferase 1 [Aphanomyces cochlioides]|nr:histone acetyltransferase 1 [Aphanomyces cochlioides]
MVDDEPDTKKLKTEGHTCPANDAVHIRIVDDPEKDWSQTKSFHPAFTYHAFGKDEVIRGYHGLEIQLTFSARTFDCLVQIAYTSRDDEYDDLITLMANSLPKNFTQDKEVFLASLRDAPSKPAGTLVDSYTKDDVEVSTYFTILSEDPQGKAYLEKMQKLSLWFIEGADDIDVDDPRWSLYVIFDVSQGRYLPMGYITIFTFNTPLKQGMSQNVRICQALILPQYHRQGHGERLVEHIMHQARSMSNVYEVTVEDPVPGFSMLRDVVDVKTCLSHGFFNVAPTEATSTAGHGTQTLTADDISSVKKALKLTKLQVQRCYEALKLRFIDRSNEEEYKAFRLEVKRRLHNLYAEDLDAMGSADRRKALLATLYSSLEGEYDRILKRCGLLRHEPEISA